MEAIITSLIALVLINITAVVLLWKKIKEVEIGADYLCDEMIKVKNDVWNHNSDIVKFQDDIEEIRENLKKEDWYDYTELYNLSDTFEDIEESFEYIYGTMEELAEFHDMKIEIRKETKFLKEKEDE